MANTAQARKRARQAVKNRARNVAQRSQLRTAIKKVINAIQAGDKTTAQAALQSAVPIIDAMSGKGIIHKNKAARHKSRLSRGLSALA